jgi:type I restriction enzyme S subunit
MKATPIGNRADELPKGWTQTTVGEIAARVQYGTSAKTSSASEGVPVIRMGNIADGRLVIDKLKYLPTDHKEFPELLLAKGDVLFNRTNSAELVGKTAVYQDNPSPCSFASYLIRVRLGHGYKPELLSHYINSCFGRAWVASVVSQQVGQANVNGSKLQALGVPVPPLPEQYRIVAEIDKQFTRLDAAVVALKRVRANLKRYGASVLRAACEGRLVPTEAELARAEGRDYEPADLLLQRILKERRAKWESDQLARLKAQGRARKDDKWKEKYKAPAAADSRALPTLPEGWVWARWEQAGFSQNGQSFPSKEYQATGIKLLRPGNLHPSGRVSWTPENTRRLPGKWATDFPRFIVGARELVINLTAQSLRDEFLGRVCITQTDERCLLNQRIARLTPVEVAPEYLLWMFKSSVFRRFVNGLNTGSLIQHMFTSQLADFCLPLPPLAEQGRIVAEVERRLSVLDEIESVVEANLKRAGRLRQSVLKRAFEGKLVPQDPNDEAASVLLERIRAERKAVGEHAASRERGNRTKKKQP